DAVTDFDLGQPLTLCSDCPGGYSAGEERLFVLVSEAQPNRDQLNLSGLIENCTGAPTTRGAASNILSDLLRNASSAPSTRSAFSSVVPDKLWVEQFAWKVLPRSIALSDPAVSGAN